MKNSIVLKTLIIGIIGGSLPLLIYLANQDTAPPSTEKKVQLNSNNLIDGNRRIPSHNINYTGLNTIDFREASKNSINSVVHVTTKVVHTSFQ